MDNKSVCVWRTNLLINCLLLLVNGVIGIHSCIAQTVFFDDSEFAFVVSRFEDKGVYLSYDPSVLDKEKITGNYDLDDPVGSFEKILTQSLYAIKKVSEQEYAIVPLEKIELCGYVIDDRGDPIPYAHIVGRQQQVAVSDDNGYFKFQPQAALNDVLEISCIGFTEEKISAARLIGECPQIEMVPRQLNLGAITVKEYLTPWN